MLVSFFESNGNRLLQGAYATVTYARVCRCHVLDQVLRPDQPADPPPCGVKVLAARADGQGARGDFGRQSADACKGDVVEAVVDLEMEVRNDIGIVGNWMEW